ncbi:MAG: hypothetical protein ACK5Q5_20310 [Planctomycetaceae bacterium]
MRRIAQSLRDANDAITRLEARIEARPAHGSEATSISIVAADGGRRYERFWHVPVGWEHDPLAIERFLKPGSWNVFMPYQRRYEMSERFAVSPYCDKARINVLYESIGWWPPGDASPRPTSHGVPVFIVDVVSHPQFALTGEIELIDGHQCEIASIPSVVSLWYDPTLNVIRKRVDRYHVDYQSDPVIGEDLFSRFVEVAPGVWLPSEIQRRVIGRGHTSVLTVTYAVNEATNAGLFDFEPPPGTLVYDRDTDTAYQLPGGEDWLDVIVERVRQQSTVPSGGATLGTIGECIVAGLLGVGSYCGVLLACQGVVWMRAHRGIVCESSDVGPAPAGRHCGE